MANVAEKAVWENGVYQIETTDPVGGGPNGIINIPIKNLANRTLYLKLFADEVEDARGDYASLQARFDSLTPIDEETQNAQVGALLEAIGLAGLANKEILKENHQRKQTGTVVISNKGIINGCVVTKSTTATRNLNGGTGVAFARGQLFPYFGKTDAASVPENSASDSKDCYAYLFFQQDGKLALAVTPLGETVPQSGIPLYRMTIPAGNTQQNDPNLANVTLTSVRRIEANYPAFYTNALYANVLLSFAMPDTDYSIQLDVVGLTGSEFQRGDLYPMDRNVNGFKIYFNGEADDLTVRWLVTKPNL